MLTSRLTTPKFLRGLSHQHYAQVDEGWLSIKSMWQGEATYWLENGRIILNPTSYLILNDRQPYTIEINGSEPTESFCIFFPAHWAGDVLRNYLQPTDQLLSDPKQITAVSFYDVLHHHDQLVTPYLQTLRQARAEAKGNHGSETEHLHQLLAAMLEVQRHVSIEAAKLPAVRTTTRKELYRRLHIGRAYIHDNLDQSITLEAIAQQAALSPYHFLRSFKQLFGQTPHTYLTHQRLQKAQQLLTTTNTSITEICFAVGFQSLGSFSTLFQKHTGRSPSQFRHSL